MSDTEPPNPTAAARRYGPAVVNELVRIRRQFKVDGWGYGPRSICYEAALGESFPGGAVPSVATIARLLAAFGQAIPDDAATERIERESDQSIVEVTRENRQIYYQGLHISLPASYAGREYFHTITDTEFLLTDPATGEIVFSFPLPLVALNVRGRYVASYAVRGVHMSWPSKYWERKLTEHAEHFRRREDDHPDLFRR